MIVLNTYNCRVVVQAINWTAVKQAGCHVVQILAPLSKDLLASVSIVQSNGYVQGMQQDCNSTHK